MSLEETVRAFAASLEAFPRHDLEWSVAWCPHRSFLDVPVGEFFGRYISGPAGREFDFGPDRALVESQAVLSDEFWLYLHKAPDWRGTIALEPVGLGLVPATTAEWLAVFPTGLLSIEINRNPSQEPAASTWFNAQDRATARASTRFWTIDLRYGSHNWWETVSCFDLTAGILELHRRAWA